MSGLANLTDAALMQQADDALRRSTEPTDHWMRLYRKLRAEAARRTRAPRKAEGALKSARRTTDNVSTSPRRMGLLAAEWPLVCRLQRLRRVFQGD